MKCRAKTYHYHVDPCNNEGAVDGYCYLHHPEVMVAKLRYRIRAGKDCNTMDGISDLRAALKEQEALLAKIPAQPIALSPRMDAAVAAS